ncbi:MAG: c-type cytochrome [Planctomycetaceae bacterium]|nr:c-type cytochrome [Planctomycetaceae bacterium]
MVRAGRSRAGQAVAVLSLFVASLAAAATNDGASAERGYQFLTTKPYFQRDFDVPTFDSLWQVWEEPARTAAAEADAPTRRRLALERYGLMEAPGRTTGVPLQYVETSDGGWTVNCFSCHGGKVAGQVIPGLPNSHVALATLQEDLHAYLKSQGREREIGDNGMPGVPLGGSNGTTNSVIFGIALGSRRDLALNYVPNAPTPIMLHHDHDAPPWWNTKRKKMLYADGFAPKSHRALMPFLMIPQTTADKFALWEDDFKDILAYIESIPAPKYPFSIDHELAAQGAKAFQRVCAECHGTYGADGVYPERNVAIDVVGTDPLRWKALTPGNRLGHQVSWFGGKGKHQVVARPAGYVAPPLDGIWASAPYLHNGSIPTLWHLFHSTQRPIVWTRTEDGYDQTRVGIEITELGEVPASAVVPAQRRRYFDTRLPGKSAAGHEFPEQLSEEEKTAVIEYLKTL